MRKLAAIVCFMCLHSSVVMADVTETAQLIKLLEQAKKEVDLMNEYLQEIKETTDFQDQLLKLEQAGMVKDISDVGTALSGVVSSLKETRGLTEDIYGNVTTVDEQVATIITDVVDYANVTGESIGALGSADARGFDLIDETLNELGTAASLLAGLENQYWTGTPKIVATANDLDVVVQVDEIAQENSERIGDGLTVDDAQRMTPEILNALLILLAQQNLRLVAADSEELRIEAQKQEQKKAESDYFSAVYIRQFEVQP